MEKINGNSVANIIQEIPPIFPQNDKIDSKNPSKKAEKSIILYRIVTSMLIVFALIFMKIITPEIYAVFNSWITEKLALNQLLL
ncbi:MAG: hypothetical protein FWH20_01340 [Oscillospiraceae bacterium]|nr:hypothetical protein [Oscillospiraceae bacterium]